MLLSWLALQGKAWGLTLRGGKGSIAQTTKATFSCNKARAWDGEIGEQLSLAVVHHGASGHVHNQVLTTGTIAVVTSAIGSAVGLDMRTVVEVHQGVNLRGYFKDDIASVPAVTAIGRSEEHTSELQSRGHLVCRLLLEEK